MQREKRKAGEHGGRGTLRESQHRREAGQGAGAQRAGEQGAGGHCGNPSIARGTLLFVAVAFCFFFAAFGCF